jgi:hypothetical protein
MSQNSDFRPSEQCYSPLIQSYTENLAATAGELGVGLGEEKPMFKPGETTHIPVGTKQQFFNPRKDRDIAFTGKAVPAHKAFEQSIYICYGLTTDKLCDKRGCRRALCICVSWRI